ncbi:MAG: hypothetical protein K2N63_10210 [Lachnospiraceae bacterium]|nr:hypothetical protein [Lachnospiraceae bacterium]
MKEGRHILLRDKREIILHDDIILQNDNAILISILLEGNTIYSYPIAYPSGGYGGGTMLLSLSEQYLLFSYYSGQSEEAYILLRIRDSYLESVYESGYLCGEGASYVFSEDENYLFQALPASLGSWYVDENAQMDENKTPYFQYGEINMLHIGNKEVKKHSLNVYPSWNWDEDMAEAEPFYISAVADQFLSLAMPWGEIKLEFPLQDIIVLTSKTA